MFINKIPIGLDHRPFIVAEMSGNHCQSLEQALSIVEAAARAGADGLKIQTYTADTMTIDLDVGEFLLSDSGSMWAGRSLHSLYTEAHTPWEWHRPIFARARKLGLTAFSTPFDETAVDFLESLEVPCYKIASFEITDIPLIKKVAATGKPVIISTGMATLSEIDEAIRTAETWGCKDYLLLKCTSTYPAAPEDSNLLTIPHMREMFRCEVGLSDHTLGLGVALSSVSLGASLIEKHLTLSRLEGGVDSTFSVEPEELALLVTETDRARRAVGRIQYGPTKAEEGARLRRRSIYIVKDVAAGEVLTTENLRCIRPGLGLSPRHYETLLGKRANRDAKRGTAASWDLIG